MLYTFCAWALTATGKESTHLPAIHAVGRSIPKFILVPTGEYDLPPLRYVWDMLQKRTIVYNNL